MAHAIHSLTLNELRKFEPTARKDNFVPVVNLRLNDPQETERVKQHAPEETLGNPVVLLLVSQLVTQCCQRCNHCVKVATLEARL